MWHTPVSKKEEISQTYNSEIFKHLNTSHKSNQDRDRKVDDRDKVKDRSG